VWRHWLVDGWFPLFPWLGVAVLGTLVSRIRAMGSPRVRFLCGGALVLTGFATLIVRPPVLVTRDGYSELFYPPTIGVLSVAIGVSFVVLSCLPRIARWTSIGWLEIYGRASLVIYVAHTVLIAYVFTHWGPQHLLGFFGLYLCHMIVLWWIARVRVVVRARSRR